jgi:cytochrome c
MIIGSAVAFGARALLLARVWRRGAWILGSLTGALLLAGCHDDDPARPVAGGDAQAGRALIASYGCGSCHVVPGVRGAVGLVGPPLVHFARRAYIAGEVPNDADFLIRWIEVPQAIEPGTAMPNLGVTEGQARSIAAYLYTLK